MREVVRPMELIVHELIKHLFIVPHYTPNANMANKLVGPGLVI